MKIKTLFLIPVFLLLSSLRLSGQTEAFPRLVKVSGSAENQGNITYDYFYSNNHLDSIVWEQKNFKLKQIFSYKEDGKIAQVEEMQWSTYRKAWTRANLFEYAYNKKGLLKTISKKVIAGNDYAEYEDYSYEYNSKNQLIMVDVYDYSRDFTYKETLYKYDDQGRKTEVLTKQTTAESGGELVDYKKEELTYNNSNQLIQKTIFVRYEGGLVADKVYDYSYDTEGGCSEIAMTPIGIKFATEIRRFVNNNSILLKDVFIPEGPQSFFPDWEATSTLRKSEEVVLVDLNQKENRQSYFEYTYADLPKSQTPNIRLSLDGSVSKISFSVTTATPKSSVRVVFPNGEEVEDISDEEYGIARFGTVLSQEQSGNIDIYTQDPIAIASQQMGIRQIQFFSAPNLRRLTIPYQTLTSLDLTSTPRLEELYLQGCEKLLEVNISGLSRLKRLNVANNSAIQITGLEQAVQMESFIAYNSGIKSLDLKNWPKIKELDLTHTGLTEIDLSANSLLTHLELTDNQLSSISLDNLNNLKVLKIGSNQLKEINLSNLTQLEELDINGNLLSRLDLSANFLSSLDCGNNLLSLGDLPAKGSMNSYIYWPQGAFPLPQEVSLEKGLDLQYMSSLLGVLGTPTASTFALMDEAGNEYDPETYYLLENGMFTFKQPIETLVRIRVLNKAFPKLTGKTASYSTFFKVTKGTSVDRIEAEKPYLVHGNRLTILPQEGAETLLFSISGELLWKSTLNSSTPSPEFTLPSGAYLLRVGTETYKIVIRE